MSAPPVRFVLSDPVPKDFWSWHKEFEKQKQMSLLKYFWRVKTQAR